MKANDELNWWIDLTGSTYTHRNTKDDHADALAAGKVYLDSKSGVITHLNGKPASLPMISQELLDVLHKRFPGTRWWIKDLTQINEPTHQAAS